MSEWSVSVEERVGVEWEVGVRFGVSLVTLFSAVDSKLGSLGLNVHFAYVLGTD